MNYYIVLGVTPDADRDTIRHAFRGLARRYHPDAGEGSSAVRFREILAAYETLNDPHRRADYDRALRTRRASVPATIEPLRAQAIPEPMRSRGTVGRTNSSDGDVAPARLHELIDALFQLLEEMSLDDRRRFRA
jgi:curved DNA-binding protein CbpA